MRSRIAVKYWALAVCLAMLPAAVAAKDTYPKLSNYYLKYFQLINDEDYNQLMKWDLLILPNEVSSSRPDFLQRYKNARSTNQVIAYVYPAMSLTLSHTLFSRIEAANLWLRDGSGNKLQIWSGLYAVNLTKPQWQSMNLDFVASKMNEGSWDGIMYDTVDTDIRRYSANGIDIDGDGRADSAATYNDLWQRSMADLFAKTRSQLGGNKLILMNGSSVDSYQPAVNGRIFEMFPTPWEGNGSWQATMYQYLNRLPQKNRQPAVYVINGGTNNTGRMTDYRKMRFGLTSALLGDGYFSFDYGDQSHEQTWWYDEYDVPLGHAESSYYNLLDPGNDYIRAGLWRRDFESGVAIVNSTAKDQLYVFNHEEFEKIKGVQDPGVNNGAKINYIKLAPNDGVIMRTVRNDVRGQAFTNGDFLRVFNPGGQQTRGGFFAYKPDASANSRLLIDDLDGNGKMDRLAEKSGKLAISGPGRKTVTLAPFGNNFKGRLSFAAYDFNRDGSKEIVIAVASAGGPQVVTYSQSGKLLSAGFFAFDKNFRGGVNIAVGDINNDGRGEIVAAPASGLAPTVKMFDEKGKALGSFLAYDKNFRGGVNMAIGDLNGDGKNELVTGPVSGGPHVRIFTPSGQLMGQFMAFDASGRTGVRVMAADIDGDGKAEILAGTSNF